MLRDRDRALNLTAMRAYRKVRQMRFDLAMQAAAASDSMGVNRILAALRLIYEDG